MKPILNSFLFLFILLSGFSAYSQQNFSISPSADVSVYEGNPGQFYGGSPILYVKDKTPAGIKRVAYLKFDISSVPTNKIGKVKLRLYCYNKGVESLPVTVTAYATSSAWEEGTINYNNAPVLGNAISSTIINNKEQYYEWDISSYVQQSVVTGGVVSVALRDDQLLNNTLEFYSKESSNVNKPLLYIDENSPYVPSEGDSEIAGKKVFTGSVAIGTSDPKGYKLAVAGKVIAEEVNVKLQANWPDYVFEEHYELPDLKSTEAFIKANKHLPGIPSAAEIKEKGISIGEMNALLLKKIEELTLYLIEKNKEIDSLKKKIDEI